MDLITKIVTDGHKLEARQPAQAIPSTIEVMLPDPQEGCKLQLVYSWNIQIAGTTVSAF